MLVRDELQRAGLETLIPAGLALAGGSSRLRCLVELAERLFALPVRLAAPRGPVGMPEELSQPAYATEGGLLMYRARDHRQAAQRPAPLRAKFHSMLAASCVG